MVPNSSRSSASRRGGAGYAVFAEALRDLLDAVSCSNPPEELWSHLEERLRDATAALQPWAAGEGNQPAGNRMDLPGRGNPMLPPFVLTDDTTTGLRGHVTFRPCHLGAGGAAHGGAITLLFDEILGRLSNPVGMPMARTAYLTVNYRQIAPIDVKLGLEAGVDKQDGRKRWITGRLLHGTAVVADAEGLFVHLRPGQP